MKGNSCPNVLIPQHSRLGDTVMRNQIIERETIDGWIPDKIENKIIFKSQKNQK